MINMEIVEAFRSKVNAHLLEKAAQAVLDQQLAAPETAETGLTLVISDDDQLQQLNRQFLNLDAPTDVLSFPAGHTDPETGASYLGDVLISYPRAEEQARAAGHPIENELQLLVVHGVLHLLGQDHVEEDDKTRMWAAQAAILDQLGVKLNRFPE